jgi:hypothetical protein
MRGPRSTRFIASALLALALPACSIRKLAVNSLGNALAEGGRSYASDDDPSGTRVAILTTTVWAWAGTASRIAAAAATARSTLA